MFIGLIGELDKNVKIEDIVISEYFIFGIGAIRYLTIGSMDKNDCYGKKYYPDKDFNKIWETTNKIVRNANAKVHIGKTFSIDTIFSQFDHLEEFINMGCNTIEMETSTLFLASKVNGIKSAVIFNVSDNVMTETDEEQERREKVKKDLITKIAIDVLLN